MQKKLFLLFILKLVQVEVKNWGKFMKKLVFFWCLFLINIIDCEKRKVGYCSTYNDDGCNYNEYCFRQDPDYVYYCIERDNIRHVNSCSECKSNEQCIESPNKIFWCQKKWKGIEYDIF